MAARTLLRVRGLHAGYGRAEVLHGLDVTADEGQVITVIGPNGAGKSTLLNALMGALPSRGTVEYQGASVALLSLEERVWRGMALVPETRALFATMSVEDNLLLGAWRQFRAGVKDSDQELNSVYMLFPRLRERRTQLAGTLSGGERTRLALAGLVSSAANVLLLDEPTNNLDPASREKVLDALRHYEGAVVLVTHDPGAVEALEPERVILLPDGTEDHFSADHLELVELA
jgi:branched-chain amino acid transport system ATP-binding protein